MGSNGLFSNVWKIVCWYSVSHLTVLMGHHLQSYNSAPATYQTVALNFRKKKKRNQTTAWWRRFQAVRTLQLSDLSPSLITKLVNDHRYLGMFKRTRSSKSWGSFRQVWEIGCEKENQEFLFTPVGYLNVANHPESKSRPQSWTFEGLIARKYDSIVLKCYKE